MDSVNTAMGTAMSTLRGVTCALLLGSLSSIAFAQSPSYGVGRTPTAEELRSMDISIGFSGEELPPGRGTAKEGAQLYLQKACVGCHGVTGIGGMAPILRSKMDNAETLPVWKKERILPLRAPKIGRAHV